MSQPVVLHPCNSDLNLVIEDRGYGASTLNNPKGFRLMWAGGRASHGVCKGKVFFEVRIEKYLDGTCKGLRPEQHSNCVRVGWSIDRSSFSLGEDNWSFGYCSTGKFYNRSDCTNYGEAFGIGDVIGAILDLQSRPSKIYFLKNGRNLGVAQTFSHFPIGKENKSLFPHVFCKNCKIKVNFGQFPQWYPALQGYKFIGHLDTNDKVPRSVIRAEKSKYEVIMMVGLPGSGKTTWAQNTQREHPEKAYIILGTDILLDQMRVTGISSSYHERWKVLIGMATKCLNALFGIAASQKRNYIIDQTNLSELSRSKKMLFFRDFRKICVVLQPPDAELARRSKKRTAQTGKDLPARELRKMKANYSLPELSDRIFHRIDYIELPQSSAEALVYKYNAQNSQFRD